MLGGIGKDENEWDELFETVFKEAITSNSEDLEIAEQREKAIILSSQAPQAQPKLTQWDELFKEVFNETTASNSQMEWATALTAALKVQSAIMKDLSSDDWEAYQKELPAYLAGAPELEGSVFQKIQRATIKALEAKIDSTEMPDEEPAEQQLVSQGNETIQKERLMMQQIFTPDLSPKEQAVFDIVTKTFMERTSQQDYFDFLTNPSEKVKGMAKKIIVIASEVLRTQEEWDIFKALTKNDQALFGISIEDEEKHLALSFEASASCPVMPEKITQSDTPTSVSKDELKANFKAKLKAKLDTRCKKTTDDTLLNAKNPCFTPLADIIEKSGRTSPKDKEPTSPPCSPLF